MPFIGVVADEVVHLGRFRLCTLDNGAGVGSDEIKPEAKKVDVSCLSDEQLEALGLV